MDINHIYFTANNAPVIGFGDYVTFESIATAFGNTLYQAIAPNSSSKLSVSARIANNVGGTGTLYSVSIQTYLWVPHLNTWVLIGDSGVFTQTTWQNLFTPVDIHTYLTSYKDWENAKVKFNYYGYGGTGGDPSKAQFQIGQVKLTFDGTTSGGKVDLLKLYNSSVGIGTSSVVVGVKASEYASSNQNYMRYYISPYGAYAINGEWNTSWVDFPVPNGYLDSPDPWVHISVFANIANGTGYVKLFNITGWDGSSVDVNGFPTTGAYLLCEVTGLNNTSDGLPDSLRYEAEYEYDYGFSALYATYLDEIYVYEIGETYTIGYINVGSGPEENLLPSPVTNNLYPDLLHSWCPRQMSNIKIYADDDESGHGWEITQIYVYRTDPVKYRVVLDSCTALTNEYKLVFNSSIYTDCSDSDNGLLVYAGIYKLPASFIGTLLNFDNDNLKWRVDITGGSYIPHTGG